MSDELIFAEETTGSIESASKSPDGTWKILIVDDEEEVHTVTRLVLDDLAFEGRRVACLSAYSGDEARAIMKAEPDVSVILLDVVMETVLAGLEVARYVRGQLHNRMVRIILRTGQPGEAPEREVVTELDINDYRSKTELTSERLVTSVITAIRSYRDLKAFNQARKGLHHLAMSVAHQIRNRTVAIGGFANLMKRNPSLPEDMSGHLSTIMEESARLEAMVGDVTRYASLELGDLVPSSIRVLLEETMERVEARQVDKGGVAWDVFCPDQTVLVDPALFIIAFEAILQNCVDFSDPKAKVQIRINPARLACTIEITDAGYGISETDLPHVFDLFFTNKPKGSGMGLSVVRKIADEHQWDITIESEFGKGTVVRVVIPRRELTGRDI